MHASKQNFLNRPLLNDSDWSREEAAERRAEKEEATSPYLQVYDDPAEFYWGADESVQAKHTRENLEYCYNDQFVPACNP